MYIVEVKKENRENFVKKFENKGFKIADGYTKESILKSVLPITLNFETKEIGKMGNVTCTVVAKSHGLIMDEEDFLKK